MVEIEGENLRPVTWVLVEEVRSGDWGIAGNGLTTADVHALQGRLRTLGSALVHAVRGFDGEGAVVLHRALVIARAAGGEGLTADILRELAFADLQAGRHASAARALREAAARAEAVADPALTAGLLAIQGMNEADQGRHEVAVQLLDCSARTAATAGSNRQEAWSTGVMARSLLLAGELSRARAAAERSIEICERERWNAFLPWPQALRAHCLAAGGDWSDARDDAEQSYALACQLGDPCWEGMAGRALALLALHEGDAGAASEWIVDARRRCDRLPDRYVWGPAKPGPGPVHGRPDHQSGPPRQGRGAGLGGRRCRPAEHRNPPASRRSRGLTMLGRGSAATMGYRRRL